MVNKTVVRAVKRSEAENGWPTEMNCWFIRHTNDCLTPNRSFHKSNLSKCWKKQPPATQLAQKYAKSETVQYGRIYNVKLYMYPYMCVLLLTNVNYFKFIEAWQFFVQTATSLFSSHTTGNTIQSHDWPIYGFVVITSIITA